jgi:hypothetical protein
VAKKQIWIGLVGIRPLPDAEVLQEVSGAYTNVLTWASSGTEFAERVRKLMDEMKMIITEIEDAEPLSNRGGVEDFDGEIAESISEVEKNPDAIVYGTFHSWKERPS